MKDDNSGGRFRGDDKIIDITDYVNKKTDDEVEIENFTNHFVEMFNKGIIEKQREEVRKRFVDLMINFLLCAQIAIVVAICFIIVKIYS